MTPEFEALKDIAKDLGKAIAGGFVVALFRRRPRRPPLSIAPEPERFSLTLEEWSDLMTKVNQMSTTIALHEQELAHVKDDHVEVKAVLAGFSTTLEGLGKGIHAIQLQLARWGAPPA